MPCREQTACAILVLNCLSLFRRIARCIDMPSHLEILDIKVVAQAKANRLLLFLIRILSQIRMRSKLLDRINFRRVRVRNTRRKHMANTRETSNFRHPDTIKFRIGRQAVIVVVRDITKRSLVRIKAHITFSLVQRIVRIAPRRTRPIARKCSARRNVNDVKKSPRVIQRVRTRIAQVLRGRILVECGITFAMRLVVKAVRKAVVELFKERLERAVLCRHLAFFQLKIEKVPAHAVLDIRQVPFEHARCKVMALRNLDRQTFVIPELSGIRQRCISLLVQNRTSF